MEETVEVAESDVELEKTIEEVSDEKNIEYSFSNGLANLLSRLNISIAFTSYQSNLVYLLGLLPNGNLHLHQSSIVRPMGLALDGKGGLVLAAGFHIIELPNVLQTNELANNLFDVCYFPRTIHLTGGLDLHDVGVDENGRIVFVNTQFNCLSTLSLKHSFEMLWKPSFISSLVKEDRCHLNGLVISNGQPAYVTAVSRSDTIDGWRDRRADGGVVIDVKENKIVCEKLSMPHSPRIHNGKLWILNAGTGQLGMVDFPKKNNAEMGQFNPLVFCPGFLRGLSFHGNLAFVGLSKPRYKRFEGLELDKRLKETDSEPWCGIQIIDIDKGHCIEWFRIDGEVAELFDVMVIPGCRCPMMVSPTSPDISSLITYQTKL